MPLGPYQILGKRTHTHGFPFSDKPRLDHPTGRRKNVVLHRLNEDDDDDNDDDDEVSTLGRVLLHVPLRGRYSFEHLCPHRRRPGCVGISARTVSLGSVSLGPIEAQVFNPRRGDQKTRSLGVGGDFLSRPFFPIESPVVVVFVVEVAVQLKIIIVFFVASSSSDGASECASWGTKKGKKDRRGLGRVGIGHH